MIGIGSRTGRHTPSLTPRPQHPPPQRYGEDATPSFPDVAAQLQETVGNLRRRGVVDGAAGALPCTIQVAHFPLFATAPLQPAALPCLGEMVGMGGASGAGSGKGAGAGAGRAAGGGAGSDNVGWFTLAGSAAAATFPLLRHQLHADLRDTVAPDLHDVSGVDIPPVYVDGATTADR